MTESSGLSANGGALARATIRGTFWTYAAYYGGKVMVLISTIILARLLNAEDFGVAGYALTIIALLDVLGNLGVGYALIYYPDSRDAADTAFWLSVMVGLVLFGLTWIGAPWVSEFFHDARAVSVTRVLGLTFPINALCNVHDMLLRKDLRFGRKFLPDFVQAMSKGLLSILLAFLSFGAWSLILAQIGGAAIAVVVYWWVLPWRPHFRFATRLARALLTYGLNIISVDTIAVIATNIDYLFVGHFLGAIALGIYSLAFRIPQLLILQFCDIVSRVLFPVYSTMQKDARALSNGFLMAARYLALVTVPLGLGLALVAEPLVLTVFGAKWIEAVSVLRAIAIYALMLSLAYNAGDVYKAQGRPYILTAISIGHSAILIPSLYWAATVAGTITAIGWVHAVAAALNALVSLTVALRLLKLPSRGMVNAFRPAAVGGLLMSLVVLGTLQATSGNEAWLQLVLSISTGGVVYLGSLWLTQRELVQQTFKTMSMAWQK